jgi:hypothetical protein
MTDRTHPDPMTDAALDAALAALATARDRTTSPPSLTTAHTRLTAALAAESEAAQPAHPTAIALTPVPATEPDRVLPPGGAAARRQRWGWVAAAAVAAVAVATPVVVAAGRSALSGEGTVPAASPPAASPPSAAAELRTAADLAARERDTPVRPGQYRYVAKRSSDVATIDLSSGLIAWRYDITSTTWVPYDQSRSWTQDNTVSDPTQWLAGSAAQAAQHGISLHGHGAPAGRTTAPCGDFKAVTVHQPPSCARTRDWYQPTSAWLATMPRDPHQLLALLRSNPQQQGPVPDAQLPAERAVHLLDSGLVPPDLRAALYRALALLPDLAVTARAVTLNGRTGLAIGVDDWMSDLRQDIVVDPATGSYLGDRSVCPKPGNGLPANTVIAETAVSTAVVPAIGTTPAR